MPASYLQPRQKSAQLALDITHGLRVFATLSKTLNNGSMSFRKQEAISICAKTLQ
jgi:hypothetical protein